MADNSNPQRVMVVEDEAQLRQGLTRAIHAMGYAPIEAGSAEAAMTIMQREPCEVILLDLRLPGMNGMQFFEMVRQRWPRTQVIVTTGFGKLESAQLAMHLDAVEFLTKPCALRDLELAIAKACERTLFAARYGTAIKPALVEVAHREEQAKAKAEAPRKSLEELERGHILAALERNDGNRTEAARELCISRRTLHHRLKEYRQQGFIV